VLISGSTLCPGLFILGWQPHSHGCVEQEANGSLEYDDNGSIHEAAKQKFELVKAIYFATSTGTAIGYEPGAWYSGTLSKWRTRESDQARHVAHHDLQIFASRVKFFLSHAALTAHRYRYGDVSPASAIGRLLAVVYMPFGVLAFSSLMAGVAQVRRGPFQPMKHAGTPPPTHRPRVYATQVMYRVLMLATTDADAHFLLRPDMRKGKRLLRVRRPNHGASKAGPVLKWSRACVILDLG